MSATIRLFDGTSHAVPEGVTPRAHAKALLAPWTQDGDRVVYYKAGPGVVAVVQDSASEDTDACALISGGES